MKQIPRPIPDKFFENAPADRCREQITRSEDNLRFCIDRIGGSRKKILPFIRRLSKEERKELYRKNEKPENKKEGFSYDLQEYVCRLILSTRMVGEIEDTFVCIVLKNINERKTEHSQEIFTERQKITEARKGRMPIVICTIPDLFMSLELEKKKWFIETTGKIVRNDPNHDWFELEGEINRLPQYNFLVSNFTAGDAAAWLIGTYKVGKLEEILLDR